MVAGGGASVIYADTGWLSMFGYRIARNPTKFFFLCIDLLYELIFADQVGDLGYASELGNYAEYSGAPNEEEVLRYARVVIDGNTNAVPNSLAFT